MILIKKSHEHRSAKNSSKYKMQLVLLLSMFTVSISSAQTIEKFSLDSGGASVSAGGIQILYTLGEVHVAERTSTTVSVSEGFITSHDVVTLGVDDLSVSTYDFIVYPNPASAKINILSDFNLTKIELFDSLGKQVLKAENAREINVSRCEPGVYFLKLSVEQVSVTKKIILK